ncbi:MAG: betaine/proline/choline family ABC transporter ATP-binding protein [Acidimicrobiales bacterium]
MTTPDSTAIAAAQPDTGDVVIRLEGVSKVYPGTEAPAVAELDLEIVRGEILVLVGPSGCGKSTTLRLINRMIEPTSGRIIFDGDDVTDVNPDELRRHIGYVIQQIGLFPHRTIAQNVGTVPRLLGWSKDKVSARVDELLDMVGMEPGTYRDRYPKELSGGQAQRVGVARALGADPPVMLMDEPFGAIDPITRERLQNEFLRLQSELQKTIVFVTHDIDEAIKMGDRIAILEERSRIAQLDSPEHILALPINDFVRDFIGSGATLKGLNFERVRDVPYSDVPVADAQMGRAEALKALRASDFRWMMVLDSEGRPARWVDESHLDRVDRPLQEMGMKVEAIVEPQATLRDALEEMVTSSAGCCAVVDGRQRLQGIIAIDSITAVLQRMQEEARRHYQKLEEASA